MSEHFERRLSGQPVSPGIAMGVLRVEARGCEAPVTRMILPTEMEAEWQRFELALSRTESELQSLKARVEKLSGATEAAIFDAHLLFLRDRTIMSKLRKEFPSRMQNIDAVYYAVVQNFMEVMRRVDDPYLRSRVVDIADVLQRVLKNMSPAAEKPGTRTLCEHCPCVLAAYDLTPSDTADLDPNKVLGFVTETGSAVSHTAILARSLGLPAVVAVPRLVMDSRAGQQVILDGYNGELILNPTPETRDYYRALQQEKDKAYQALVDMRDLPSETLDGRHIRLAANVEFAHEYDAIRRSGAEGVGLFRTEFFLLGGDSIPDEEMQYEHYRALVESCAPHEVIFRTLDSGGDKLPFEVLDEKEDNPFLGWRGIRVSLSRPEIFKEQLRAILRASAHGKVGVMFPMVSGLTEVREVHELLEECRAELRARNLAFDENMRVGIMIEVPSAAMMSDVLARYVDFFSIGTNDLTQYTIAVDRVNYRVASMFRSTHPGVIRLMRQTINAGIPTAVCGEMGADIKLLPLLVGLGATELSVGTHLLPLVRYAIRHLNYEECRAMAEEALLAEDSYTIRALSKALAKKSYPGLFE
ncbi:MAG: phosphoenolpyruvate--protein phosphotransferase [Akkermansia sp.]|nr:phosphoenolpyruvate--protein phosphotransferase [Akkermansia sp.]